MILTHGAAQDRGVTALLDDLVRRTTRRLGGGGGVVTLVGDRAPLVQRAPLPPVDDVLARLVREPRTLLVEGGAPGAPDVLGAPLWWDDELLGACAFGGGGSFSARDVAAVEGFAAQAAVAVMAVRLLTDDPAVATAPVAPQLLPELRAELDRALRALGVRGGVVTLGAERVPDPVVAVGVHEVARLLLDNAVHHSGADSLRVGLVFEPGTVRLLVEDDGRGFDPATAPRSGLDRVEAAVRAAGGRWDIDSVPGWGTRVRVCWPDPPAPGRAGPAVAGRTPVAPRGGHTLTVREREVRELVEQGLADKQIATRLAISVKTVEKHVGAVLRKTGARNRTMLARFGAGS
ncbi:LuxR C-terminal-related transcriptional regulator [Pseudonocardia sp. ICBG1293]|uniref:LuxR C-terminal-related transcriptional regulator n=1 Tax=Pseudonocardia sp. ICBG1293 TaxID=2844382 RepID=UPI001CC9EAF4|nr:LuxR C-terminal-related transcriptional regulator [Pseudonocardia sp. ICBG1293]